MSRSIDSQREDNADSSVHPAHSSVLSKKDGSGESQSKNVASTYSSSFNSATKHSGCSTSKSRQISDIELSSTFAETERMPEKCLSAWEKWLCSKEEEKRKLLWYLNEQKRQKEIEEKIEDEKRLERKLLAEAAHEKWLKHVEEDRKRQMKTKREKAERERIVKEEKEKKIKEIASQKYHDWMTTKEKLKEEKKREEMLKDQAREKKLEEKKQLNEEAFKKWLKEVSRRPKLQSSIGYGYAGGVLISYHDGTSSPRPSYCNPNPWVHCTENKNDE